MVEVLDTNGLQRSVQIFPEATPYLIEDLRAGNAAFYAVPQDSTPEATKFLVAFATALVSTLVSYLVDTCELSDVSELEMSNLLTSVQEAWESSHDGSELPDVHSKRILAWLSNVPRSIPLEGDASRGWWMYSSIWVWFTYAP